jgi:uncharacterized protein (TIGR00730 family)
MGDSKSEILSGGDTVSLADEAATVELIKGSILGLWQVVNNLTRLRPSHRPGYRVTIFGSARIDPGHWVYGAVRDVAAELARMGCTVITGGGPGLMQAANEGVALGGANTNAGSVGIRVHLPFEQNVNAFVSEAFEHGTFFSRLHHFVLASDAFVVVPGGVGTLLEAAMIWQLLQVRKLDAPLILVGEMWHELVDWARRAMLRLGSELASPADMEIPVTVTTGDEAVAVLRKHHSEWATRQPTPQ